MHTEQLSEARASDYSTFKIVWSKKAIKVGLQTTTAAKGCYTQFLIANRNTTSIKPGSKNVLSKIAESLAVAAIHLLGCMTKLNGLNQNCKAVQIKVHHRHEHPDKKTAPKLHAFQSKFVYSPLSKGEKNTSNPQAHSIFSNFCTQCQMV